MAFEEFCLKFAFITSAHVSLARVGHMAKPDISGMGKYMLPSWMRTASSLTAGKSRDSLGTY